MIIASSAAAARIMIRRAKLTGRIERFITTPSAAHSILSRHVTASAAKRLIISHHAMAVASVE